MTQVMDFRTDPAKYRHWRVTYHGDVANLIMDVDETAGLFEGYELKLNSYDLGVDIELNDIVQRMRFEHPEVKVVVMQSGKDKVFSAGANIRMLGAASHSHKVNFCKFTNETRNAYEAAEADSGQKYIAAIKGACAGGGYELALACNYIMLTDDSSSAVGLPEVPLLAVLPGTGVVDEVIANSKFDQTVQERALEFAAASDKAGVSQGIELGPLERQITEDGIVYEHINVTLDRSHRRAEITLKGPSTFLAHEAVIATSDHWLAVEMRHYWKRTLKRIDVTSRSLAAFVENGSCFVGLLSEILFAVDRTYMMEGEFEDDERLEAEICLSSANFGGFPMGNDLTRLQTRFLGEPERVAQAQAMIGVPLAAEQADALALVTMILDDIDWDDELRIFMEERASFSPDAMTGMEANLRFAGPETMETRIFGRLTAWQNWIFNRPNAVGQEGALQRYGTGLRGNFDMERV